MNDEFSILVTLLGTVSDVRLAKLKHCALIFVMVSGSFIDVMLLHL